ncbi:hypothetical protein NDU88_001625 [Pleurodeles waltl]|uniref:Uncharacterized protein n=1 Tax=Pleurodeles waltl TaxID=8319 RepID=A0AAV7VCC5_PLEWA|nr:hypothetical protein NDU88_001625 [Pleurodeles waltl]
MTRSTARLQKQYSRRRRRVDMVSTVEEGKSQRSTRKVKKSTRKGEEADDASVTLSSGRKVCGDSRRH